MNPDTNKFEGLSTTEQLAENQLAENQLADLLTSRDKLVRPDGTPVPDHWSIFREGELVTVKNYTFKVAHIGESHLLLEPHGPVIFGEGKDG